MTATLSCITNRTLILLALVATVALMLVAIAAHANGTSQPFGHAKIEHAAGKTVSGKPSRRA
jgi:predicted transglutaminase-like cysteine proteinase